MCPAERVCFLGYRCIWAISMPTWAIFLIRIRFSQASPRTTGARFFRVALLCGWVPSSDWCLVVTWKLWAAMERVWEFPLETSLDWNPCGSPPTWSLFLKPLLATVTAESSLCLLTTVLMGSTWSDSGLVCGSVCRPLWKTRNSQFAWISTFQTPSKHYRIGSLQPLNYFWKVKGNSEQACEYCFEISYPRHLCLHWFLWCCWSL